MLHSGQIFGRFPDLNKGILLRAKAEEDPETFDPEAMAALRHRKALSYDEQDIPEFYLRERALNQTSARKP